MLKTAMAVGLVAGLLVGLFHNSLTVPVIEEAIALEEAASVVGDDHDHREPLVSLGAQRVGQVLGTIIFGMILGAIFVPLRILALRVVSDGRPRLASAVAGGAGFWAVSLLPALRYPSNPPGVGEASTLAFRQGFQFLFVVLSAAALVGLLVLGARELRRGSLAAVGGLYALVCVALYVVFPGNPDPVTAPLELVREFRVLTVVGHGLLWALIAGGVALVEGRWKGVPRSV